MIQDIFPHQYDIGFKPRGPEDSDYVLVFRDNRALLDAGQDGAEAIPQYRELRSAGLGAAEQMIYLFSVDEQAFFLHADPPGEENGYQYRDVQGFRNFQPPWLAFAGITASHLALWYARNRLCGTCGTAMVRKSDERAVQCPSCGNTLYPGISPAVIVAVTDGDRLIMTRYANRPFRNYALIAGFMEVGETLEDTVRREVMEEVGVKVKNIRYYKSQPWGFSSSLLVGFYADLDGSDKITVDGTELEEAMWFPREEMAPRPADVSLTSEMMERFRLGEIPL